MHPALAVRVASAADRTEPGATRREALLRAGSAEAWSADRPTPPLRPFDASVRCLPWEDPSYPEGLRALPCPPAVLFVRGEAPLPPPERCVALIGARRATPEGLAIARDLARGLAEAGVVVVSGLALGVDAAAHGGAIDGGGRTLAVLASAVDHPTPRRNLRLAEELLERGGWLVSERPPAARVGPESFPRRNRLVAALSGAVVVVEAGMRSGTLGTTARALELGREVAAVPGSPLSPASAGANRLLAEGAHVVTSVADVLALLGRARDERAAGAPSPDEASVLAAVPGGSAPVGAWLGGASLPEDRARRAMLSLLSRGALRRLPGGRIARTLG